MGAGGALAEQWATAGAGRCVADALRVSMGVLVASHATEAHHEAQHRAV